MVDARYMYTAGIPARRVAVMLSQARLPRGLTQRDLAVRMRVQLRTVRDWERGDRVPTDDQMEAIAQACGLQITELLPRRGVLTYDADTGVMCLGTGATQLSTSRRDNDDVLHAFLGLVRQERHVGSNQEVAVRGDDLEALAEALDLDDEELEQRLMHILGLDRRQAAQVRARLLRRRLTVGVASMIAGLSLVAANRAFSTGVERVNTVGGGRVVRGNPFAQVTTVVTTPLTNAAAGSTAVVVTDPAPASTAAAVSVVTAPPNTQPGPPPTLPAVVLAVELEPPAGLGTRTGPPRTTSPPQVSHPVVTDPVDTATPTTVLLPGPPTLPPDTSPTSTPTTTPVTSPWPPPTPPPVTTTVMPPVSTIGGGGTTGTTEAPPPTTTTTSTTVATTTTTEAPTTTTTEATTTTTEATTTTTEATTTTTLAP